MTTEVWGPHTILPDGHRLFPATTRTFTEVGKGHALIAIADESGDYPQDTDDGVLWLDFEWRLIITSPDEVLCIPVIRGSDDERFSVNTNMSTMLYLSLKYDWPIEDQITSTNYIVNKESK